jgi:hypothetical protein
MAVMERITDAAELRDAGIRALTDVLGGVNAQEFLMQWRGIPGRDFTKWLNEQPKQSHDEVMADIRRAQERVLAASVPNRAAARQS